MPVLKLWDGAGWVEVEAAAPAHTHNGSIDGGSAFETYPSDVETIDGGEA